MTTRSWRSIAAVLVFGGFGLGAASVAWPTLDWTAWLAIPAVALGVFLLVTKTTEPPLPEQHPTEEGL